MKAILFRDVPKLGLAGDEVQVAKGYFRNYLLPRKLAVEATPQNRRLFEQRKERLHRVAARELEDAKRIAEKLDALTLTTRLKAGEDDRLFGSVTTADIASKLKEAGFEVDRKRILLDEAIRTLGLYTIHIKVHPEVIAKIKLLVEKQ